ARDRRDRSRDRREPRGRLHAHVAARRLMQPEEARPRLAALGFRPEDVETLAAHFLDAERRGSLGHGLSRIEWLESWDALPVDVRPERLVAEPGYELWDGHDGLGYLTLAAVIDAQLADPPPHAR